MEHLKDNKTIIPEGLLKRWREFGQEVKLCWNKAHKEAGPDASTEKLFEIYFNCMRKGAYHKISYEEAVKAGIEPHPICVISKVSKGIEEKEARTLCLKEGKYLGISVLMAKLKGEI